MASGPERKLAAILAADVAGYSALVSENEDRALSALRKLRSDIIEPKAAEHRGRLFKTMGDGFLLEFSSVVNAAACAAAIQDSIAKDESDVRLALRIGVNVGDVVFDEGDLLGDGVNVAARLEGLSPPGGVVLSEAAYVQLGNRLPLRFEYFGEHAWKNLPLPVRTYLLKRDQGEGPSVRTNRSTTQDKASIAVLPFANMSSDPEQEYFADGLAEDLITDLSRNAGLFVIARNSTFAYKNRSVDVRRIAADLGVRYLLEGSARRAGNRLRVNVQLIDATSGAHVWAERFDRDLHDIFAVQDEVTARIVEALVGKLVRGPARARTDSIEAYDLCVRARNLQATQAGDLTCLREGQALLNKALAIDPDFAEAHRWLAFNHWSAWAQCNDSDSFNRPLSVRHAERAVALDPSDAGNQWVLGYVLAYEHRWREVDAAFKAALAIDPNNADAYAALTDITVMAGEAEAALAQIEQAFRLNPYPTGWYYWEMGLAQYAAGKYAAAAATLRNDATYGTGSRRILAASLAQLGELEAARSEAGLYQKFNPSFTISRWAAVQPYRDAATLAHFVDGYRKAGLPE